MKYGARGGGYDLVVTALVVARPQEGPAAGGLRRVVLAPYCLAL
jgi:hypothetical protein